MDEQEERAAMVARIIAALSYRSGADSVNSVYMGGMATAGVYSEVGLRYGHDSQEDLIAALHKASDKRLIAAFMRCRWVIEYMERNPRKVCPCCNGSGYVAP